MPSEEPRQRDHSDPQQPDWYFERGLLVYTSAYHLKRGSCCGSGCRHCPYEPRHVEGGTTRSVAAMESDGMTTHHPVSQPRQPQVLLVEDDGAARRALAAALRAEQFIVFEAADGTFGLEIAAREALDLVVLDLMLPQLGGERMLARLRGGNDVPVIVVSAKRSEDDRVRVLDLGADDYLVKPFTVRELLARVRAVLRRSDAAPPALTLGDIVVDFGSKTAQRGDQKIGLTVKEFALLVHLARCRGRLVSREELDRAIHPDAAEPREDVSNVVDVLVLRLRRKLGRELISTRRGQGFIIEG